jgi:hypothetical protein
MPSSQSQAQSDQGDEIFLAFKEWLKIQEARHARVAPDRNSSSDSQRNEFHFSPAIAPVEPSIGVYPRQNSFREDGISRRRSVGKRVFRTFAYGVIIIVAAGAALAWQSTDDKTKDMVRAWGISLNQLISVPDAKSPIVSDKVTEPVSKTSQQTSVAGPSPDAHQQLESMVSDLAAVRRIVERLAVKQEQMAQDIATLQAAEQNVGEKKPTLPQSSAVPPRKNIQSEAAVQRSPVPLPLPRPQTPLTVH